MKHLLPQELPEREMYQWMVDAIVPRPIAWVGTQNTLGQTNLAPFSFFNIVSGAPPVLSVSILNKSDGSKKDTLLNILETQQCTISMVSHPLLDKMNMTSAELPYGESEFERAGLQARMGDIVKAPFVAEAAIAFECTLYQTSPVHNAHLVLLNVVKLHVSEASLNTDRLDCALWQPVFRCEGKRYGWQPTLLELHRPR